MNTNAILLVLTVIFWFTLPELEKLSKKALKLDNQNLSFNLDSARSGLRIVAIAGLAYLSLSLCVSIADVLGSDKLRYEKKLNRCFSLECEKYYHHKLDSISLTQQ